MTTSAAAKKLIPLTLKLGCFAPRSIHLCLTAVVINCLSTAVVAQVSCDEPSSLQRSISGQITRDDFETYVEVPFELPSGVKALAIKFDYDRENRTTIDLGLLDPNGFRGWSGGNKSEINLSANSATASYSTGPLIEGTWHVLLGVPNIRVNQTANYSIEITLQCDSQPDTLPAKSDRGAAWYQGDLHTHTGHSDGSCDNAAGERVLCPTFKNLEIASAGGLDFVAISDHNSVSQNANNEILQSYFSDTLLIPAREVTTFFGHANVFGTTEFIDFRLETNSDSNAEFLFDQVDELAALLSINHPGSPSGEDCMGCGWVLEGTDYSRVSAMEIVNAGFVDIPRGRAHIEFWQRLLNEGFKITGIGGSDSHLANRASETPSAIGNPSTWVFADNLSVFGILEGIKSGNVFVEASAGSGRITGFAVDGQPMGSTVVSPQWLTLEVGWQSQQQLAPRWIHNGSEIEVSNQRAEPDHFWGEVPRSSLQLPGWIRVDLMDENGATKVIGNPVYLQ